MERMSTRAVVTLGAAAALLLGGASTALVAVAGAAPGPAAHRAGEGSAAASTCSVPPLPGTVVRVALSDMAGHGRGPMMSGGAMRGEGWTGSGGTGRMMRVMLRPGTVPAGAVSLRVRNSGVMEHELVVLPLAAHARAGERGIGSDGTVDESGSLGEASATCAAGEGDGLTPGATGWTTLRLRPGRYELVCNLPGHYAAGMYAELDVAGSTR